MSGRWTRRPLSWARRRLWPDPASRDATAGHVLSVDLEDWYDSFSTPPAHPVSDRARIGVERLLTLLEDGGHRATFFVLGDVARRDPSLIQEIAAAGHEIASHGMAHVPVHQRSREAFADDLRAARDQLEDLVEAPVLGYRAPWWSIVRKNLHWLEDVAAAGHVYDASVFPAYYNGVYGIGDACLHPHQVVFDSGRELLEVPPAIATPFGFRMPIGGGIYWRILPPSLVLRALRRWAERGQTAVLYMHPWELDLEQPVAEVGWADWLIHYANLASSVRMIERVLAACSFDSIRDRVLNQPVERYHLHDGRLRRAASASTSRG